MACSVCVPLVRVRLVRDRVLDTSFRDVPNAVNAQCLQKFRARVDWTRLWQ